MSEVKQATDETFAVAAVVADTVSGLPRVPRQGVPSVTAAQMTEVDRLAIEEFDIALLAMMEQAGSHLAELTRLMLGGDLRGRSVVVAAGPGNNGGGGLAAARHLTDRGAAVTVVLARPALRSSEAARRQLATLLAMNVACCVGGYDMPAEELRAALAGADAVIDALLGYNGRGVPRGEVAALIESVNRSQRPVIGLDIPSGLDPDTGEARGVAISAAATLTLALPKTGLTAAGASRVGRLYLADIGLPRALYSRLGLDPGVPFATGRIVELVS